MPRGLYCDQNRTHLDPHSWDTRHRIRERGPAHLAANWRVVGISFTHRAVGGLLNITTGMTTPSTGISLSGRTCVGQSTDGAAVPLPPGAGVSLKLLDLAAFCAAGELTLGNRFVQLRLRVPAFWRSTGDLEVLVFGKRRAELASKPPPGSKPFTGATRWSTSTRRRSQDHDARSAPGVGGGIRDSAVRINTISIVSACNELRGMTMRNLQRGRTRWSWPRAGPFDAGSATTRKTVLRTSPWKSTRWTGPLETRALAESRICPLHWHGSHLAQRCPGQVEVGGAADAARPALTIGTAYRQVQPRRTHDPPIPVT